MKLGCERGKGRRKGGKCKQIILSHILFGFFIPPSSSITFSHVALQKKGLIIHLES